MMVNFISRRKLIALSFLIFLAIFINPRSSMAGDPFSYPPYPQNEIGIATPEIGIEVHFDSSTKLNSSVMELDGARVNVNYDEKRHRFFYQPTAPLKAGAHQVKLYLGFMGYQVWTHSWTFTVNAQALTSFPKATSDQLTALQAVNDYRKLLGIQELTLNNSLSLAATGHAKYMDLNDLFSHYEIKGKSGFFGEDVGDRTQYYGFSNGVYEDISEQYDASPINAVDGLFDAPYHRIPFMDPDVNEFGYGQKGFFHALNFGVADPQEAFVTYPTADGKNIPAQWNGNEIPDPLRNAKGIVYPVGYPIMAGIYGPSVNRVEYVSGKLVRNSDGKELAIQVNSAPADEHLTREVIMIPILPLSANETYTVEMQLNAVSPDGSKTSKYKKWSFTTEKVSGAGVSELHSAIPVVTGQVMHEINLTIGKSDFQVDGQNSSLEVPPQIITNLTYLPFRAIGEALQANVDWDNIKKAAIFKKGDIAILLYLNNNIASVNGQYVKMDGPAKIISNRTMVPLRFVSEQLGADVTWDPVLKKVTIQYE